MEVNLSECSDHLSLHIQMRVGLRKQSLSAFNPHVAIDFHEVRVPGQIVIREIRSESVDSRQHASIHLSNACMGSRHTCSLEWRLDIFNPHMGMHGIFAT